MTRLAPLLLLLPALALAEGPEQGAARPGGVPAAGSAPAEGAPDPARPRKVAFRYLHHLATPTGDLHISWPRLSFDPWNHETLLVDGGRLRFFIASGMEVYRVNEGGELGQVVSAAPLQGGELVLLVVRDGRAVLVRTDFRGRRLHDLTLKPLPWSGEEAFRPSVMAARDGRLYLLDEQALRLVVATAEGEVERAVDLAPLIGEEARGGEFDIRGLTVGRDGTVYFAIPTRFRVYLVAPDGTSRAFGQRGDKLGRFNVVAGAAADEDGVIYTSDALKGAVQVFDVDFRFVEAIAGAVAREARLGALGDVMVAENRLYVAQGGNRGVAVFAITKE